MNAVSHHSPEHHRVIGNIRSTLITDKMFEEALKIGEEVWDQEVGPPKHTINEQKDIKQKDKGKKK